MFSFFRWESIDQMERGSKQQAKTGGKERYLSLSCSLAWTQRAVWPGVGFTLRYKIWRRRSENMEQTSNTGHFQQETYLLWWLTVRYNGFQDNINTQEKCFSQIKSWGCSLCKVCWKQRGYPERLLGVLQTFEIALGGSTITSLLKIGKLRL